MLPSIVRSMQAINGYVQLVGRCCLPFFHAQGRWMSENKPLTPASDDENFLLWKHSLEPTGRRDMRQIDIYKAPPGAFLVHRPRRKSPRSLHRMPRAASLFSDMHGSLVQADPAMAALFSAAKEPMFAAFDTKRFALVNLDTCKYLCTQLGDIGDSKTVVALGNAGPGILSTALVKHGVNALFICEPNQALRNHLQNLHKDDAAVTVVDHDPIVPLWSTEIHNYCLTTLLSDSSRYEKIKVVHTLRNTFDLSSVYKNWTLNHAPYHQKDVEFYFVVDKELGETLTMNNFKTVRKNGIKCMFMRFFDSEEVCHLPTDSFYPPFTATGYGIYRTNRRKDSLALVIRSKLRQLRSFDGRTLSDSEKPLFTAFMNYCLTASSTPVVHFLEKMASGVGLDIIQQRLPLFIRFNQLQPAEFLTIFFIFLDRVGKDRSIWTMIENSLQYSRDTGHSRHRW